MPKVELLNPENHSKLKIKTGLNPKFTDTRNVIAVVAGELPQLVLDYPVFFTKNPESGTYEMVAVTGFSDKENLFIQDGKLNALYVPLDMRRQPFQAVFVEGNAAQQQNDVKIGLNVGSNRVNKKEGVALFDADGKPTEFVNEMSELLGSLVRGLQATQGFIKALEEKELIETVTINIKQPDGSDQKLEGLSAISKQKLAELDEKSAAEFHKNGYLQAAHAMIHSVGHVQKLINWKVATLSAK